MPYEEYEAQASSRIKLFERCADRLETMSDSLEESISPLTAPKAAFRSQGVPHAHVKVPTTGPSAPGIAPLSGAATMRQAGEDHPNPLGAMSLGTVIAPGVPEITSSSEKALIELKRLRDLFEEAHFKHEDILKAVRKRVKDRKLILPKANPPASKETKESELKEPEYKAPEIAPPPKAFSRTPTVGPFFLRRQIRRVANSVAVWRSIWRG